MSRINIPTREQALPETQKILDGVNETLGFVPNVVRLLSLSPIALQGFVGLQGTLAKSLDLKTRSAVSLAVSRANGCNYCTSAHSFTSHAMSKTPIEEIELNLQGKSRDPRTGAAALFGKRLIETRGKVSDADLEAIRSAGFSDGEIVEIIAFATQVSMTNFMNNVADTDIDIPSIKTA